jgi:hypothetical protein
MNRKGPISSSQRIKNPNYIEKKNWSWKLQAFMLIIQKYPPLNLSTGITWSPLKVWILMYVDRLLECLQAYGWMAMTVLIEWTWPYKQERMWGSAVIIDWSMFVKSSLFFDSIRCASRFMIWMIIEVLIRIFDLIDFVVFK